jgi:DNA-directed RNA polymerase subunit omega
MRRTEELAAAALERVDYDKYLLANAVGKRAKELAKGAPSYLEREDKEMKFSDIALQEIAEGKILVHFEE